MKYPNIETNRLLLRGFTFSDVPRVQELAGQFEIADTTLRIPHPYEEGLAVKWIAEHGKLYREMRALNFAIILKPEKLLIGAISLMDIKNTHLTAEMGYWIGKEYWNRGFASEAAKAIIEYGFRTLGMNRIHAHHFSRNEASGRILLKIGMKHEGKLRQHVKKWDKFEDIEMYGILRSEFEK
jgi:RimJ/RimL family protein N-acetyltransferase